MNYFPQADPGGICCPCPDRSAPCDDCSPCSAACELPEGDCPHTFCFEFNPATQELEDGYWDSGNVVEMRDENDITFFTIVPYIYDVGGGIYNAGLAATYNGTPVFVEKEMTLAAFFDNWHCVTLVGSDGNWSLTAYGESETGAIDTTTVLFSELFVGSNQAFPGPVDISVRGIKILANPEQECIDEQDFIFPTDSFDSSVGAGQSIDGGTVRVVSVDGLRNGYVVGLNRDLVCDTEGRCPGATSYNVQTTVTFTGTYTGSGCNISFDESSTFTDTDSTCCFPLNNSWIFEHARDSSGIGEFYTCGDPVTETCDLAYFNYSVLGIMDGDDPKLSFGIGGLLTCGNSPGPICICGEDFGDVGPLDPIPFDPCKPTGTYSRTATTGGGVSVTLTTVITAGPAICTPADNSLDCIPPCVSNDCVCEPLPECECEAADGTPADAETCDDVNCCKCTHATRHVTGTVCWDSVPPEPTNCNESIDIVQENFTNQEIIEPDSCCTGAWGGEDNEDGTYTVFLPTSITTDCGGVSNSDFNCSPTQEQTFDCGSGWNVTYTCTNPVECEFIDCSGDCECPPGSRLVICSNLSQEFNLEVGVCPE